MSELPEEAKVLLDHALQQLGIDDYEQVEPEAVGRSDIPLLYLDSERVDLSSSVLGMRTPTWTMQIDLFNDYLEWVDDHWRGTWWDGSPDGRWIVYYKGPTCL